MGGKDRAGLVRVVEQEPDHLGRDRLRCPSSFPTPTLVPISEYSIAIRHSAMFLHRIGNRVPLVITPTWDRPRYSQSPYPAVSLPSSPAMPASLSP